jgi:uncharacterized protein YegP (UPF0339 family)
MHIELRHKKQWYFAVVGANGETMLVSETYFSKWNARRQAKKLALANNIKYKERA